MIDPVDQSQPERQRCRVHWMRNALAHVSKGQHTVVAAAIRQAFDQPHRADVVGVRSFLRTGGVMPLLLNEASIMRLIGAVLLEQNDEWQFQNRYMQVEVFTQFATEETEPILSIMTQAA